MIVGKPSAFSLCRFFNHVKDANFPWIRALPYAITESAFRNLGSAFTRYFKEKKSGVVGKKIARMKKAGKWEKRTAKMARKGRFGFRQDPGYPQFKKKGKKDAFQLRTTRIEHDRVRLTGPIGWVRLKERGYIPVTDSDIKFGVYATISRRGDRWFISVLVEEEISTVKNTRDLVLGVDFGLAKLATAKDVKYDSVIEFENYRPLQQRLRKLKRLQRELSRRQKGGNNWKKTRAKIQKCHVEIANARKYVLHQISHDLTAKAKPKMVVLEDLNVSGMMKNKNLSRQIFDAGWAEERRQVEYKTKWYGSEILISDRFYPSSRLCRACGCVNHNLKLSDRAWTCECGEHYDRDIHAADNLSAYGRDHLEGRNTPGLPAELG